MPALLQVRPATLADLDAVISLAASIPEAPHWPRAAWESYLPESVSPRSVFVAQSDGKLAGFVVGQIIADVCELDSIAVAPHQRRSGVATSLLGALIGWAQSQGASQVQLEVRSENTSAILLYERSGFRRDGLRPAYYRNPPDDALLMSLSLLSQPGTES